MIQDIDRKTAGKILKVTVRTIDRYVRRGTLAARQENGRIWLNKREVFSLSQGKNSQNRPSIDGPGTAAPVYSYRGPIRPSAPREDFYKDLYEEARRVLLENQQKLEQSHYRIGQLESQILHPLHQTQPAEKGFIQESATKEIHTREILLFEKELSALKEIVNKEKSSRIAFAVMTYILLALLPVLWYLLR